MPAEITQPLAPVYNTATAAIPAGAAPIQVNVTVQAPPPNTIVIQDGDRGPGFLIRALYFLFIGSWLSFVWLGLAWVLNLTVIGLPVGLAMINRVPKVMTLRPDTRKLTVTQSGNTTVIRQANAAQLSFVVRALYFVVVGWWLSAVAFIAAWLLCLFILTMPIGLIIVNYLPEITTLRRK